MNFLIISLFVGVLELVNPLFQTHLNQILQILLNFPLFPFMKLFIPRNKQPILMNFPHFFPNFPPKTTQPRICDQKNKIYNKCQNNQQRWANYLGLCTVVKSEGGWKLVDEFWEWMVQAFVIRVGLVILCEINIVCYCEGNCVQYN